MAPSTVVTTDPSSIVALRSLNARPCAKVIRPGANGGYQVTGYGKETNWWPEVYPASSFGELAASLEAMAERDDIIVVTGALPATISLLPNIGVMRRLQGGGSAGGLFFPCPRTWVALDFDGACPSPDAASDEEALRVLRSALPKRFNDVSCVYQFTSSHLLSGNSVSLRVRLWFMLDAPVDVVRWKTVFAPIRTDLCLDTSIYHPVQPIFICPPTFVQGAADPVLSRIGILHGDRELVPTEGLPDAATTIGELLADTVVQGNEDQIEDTLIRILAQRTSGSRHHHLLGAAAELVGIGCPNEKMIPVLNELVRAQGRDPQPMEVLNAIRAAKSKLAEGKLITTHLPPSKVFASPVPAIPDAKDATAAPEDRPDGVPETDSLDYGNHSFLNAVRWLDHYYPNGGLVRWQQNDYEWDGTCYQRRDAEWLESKVQNTTSMKTSQVMQTAKSIRARIYTASELTPFWLDDPWKPAHNFISFKNGILDLDEWLLDPWTPLRSHDRNLFSLSSCPYDFNPDAKAPTFDRWLGSMFPDDPATQHEYLKMLGYCLLSDNRMQKMFVLHGPRRSGKGLTLSIIEQLVGSQNTAPADFAMLEGNFGLATLIGKRIAVMGEVEENIRVGSRVVSRLKSIVGNDMVPIDRKNKDVVMQRLACRFIICCNQLPKFLDPSGALSARMVLFPLTVSYAGREDYDLGRKLSAERPGILNRALEGLRALALEGRFHETRAANSLMRQFEEVMNPAGAFFADSVEFTAGVTTRIDDVYRAYKAWAHDGELHLLSKPAFTSYVRQQYQFESFKPRVDHTGTSTGPSRPKFWKGLRLNGEGLEWLRLAGPDASAFDGGVEAPLKE